ncbi:MAG: hypothetical protein IT379_13240 [Deltaproteobacteria bacterium]|nr:hypothetical protein [Deltaproteobacteria bacterium]
MTAPAMRADGPGWHVVIRHEEHTVYFLDYEDDAGTRSSVRFDPREDGPNVYLPEALSSEGEILDRLATALDGFFPHDSWYLWTATWPRFPLRWKGAHDHVVEHWPPSRLQYGERGRGIDLVCEPLGSDPSGRPRVRVHLPPVLQWAFPPGAGALDAAERARVVERLAASTAVSVELVP